MKPQSQILVLRDNKEELVEMRNLFESLGVFSHIRIHQSEYNNIDGTKKYFTHFNLESTSHRVGEKYALPKIIRNGYEKNGEAVLPLLSYEDIYFAECVEVGNNIMYESLDPKIFEYSMNNIKDTESLKQIILMRYRLSRPELSDREILSKGVGYTFLRFI